MSQEAAEELRAAAARVREFALSLEKARPRLLDAVDGGKGFDAFNAATSLGDLRSQLIWLFQRLRKCNLLVHGFISSEWTERCGSADAASVRDLIYELEDCMDWGAAWRQPELAAAPVEVVDLCSLDQSPAADAPSPATVEDAPAMEEDAPALEEAHGGARFFSPASRTEVQELRELVQELRELLRLQSVLGAAKDGEISALKAEVNLLRAQRGSIAPPEMDTVDVSDTEEKEEHAGQKRLLVVKLANPKAKVQKLEGPAEPEERSRRAVEAGPSRPVGQGSRVLLSNLMEALHAGKGKGVLLPDLFCTELGFNVFHAAACSDRSAPVLAQALALAAADVGDALKRALAQPTGAGAHASCFAKLPWDKEDLAEAPLLDRGATPLDVAAAHGALECVQLLLQAGARANCRSATLRGSVGDASSVDLASACGREAVLRLMLCRSPALAHAPSEHGWQPLHWAAERMKAGALQLLLRYGADPEARDGDGRTAVIWALESAGGHVRGDPRPIAPDRQEERVSCFVELELAKARATKRVPKPDTPAYHAGPNRSRPVTFLHCVSNGLTDGSLDFLRLLLASPADYDIDVGAGALGSPLDLAVHAGWVEGALLLLNRGADVNSRDKERSTPLMRAACLPSEMGGSDCIRLCFLKGADLDLQDSLGRSALHLAAERGILDALRTLRVLGANLTLRDQKGLTPLDVARKCHSKDAALLNVLEAQDCPPRQPRRGEDILCSLEEVAILAGEGVVLDEYLVFINQVIEAGTQQFTAKASASMQEQACCDCAICLPGKCPCLRGLCPLVTMGFDTVLIEDCVGELCGQNPNTTRAVRLLKGREDTGHEIDPLLAACSALATGVHLMSAGRATHDKRTDKRAKSPEGALLGIGPVGAAAALLALREVADSCLPAKVSDTLGAHSQWQTRVLAVAKSGSCNEIVELLLQLDGVVADVLIGADEAMKRMRPVWEAKVSKAWLDFARPVWRAKVRQQRKGAAPSLESLAVRMEELAFTLRSIMTPLRVGASTGGSMRDVTLCSPRCRCAGGGCRAAGVQFPLELREQAGCGLSLAPLCDVVEGALLAPYVGELITRNEAEMRHAVATDACGNADAPFYDLDLDDGRWAHLNCAVLDPRHFGNASRFINHACTTAANLQRVAVSWAGLEAPLVFFCAARRIAAGTALSWDYFGGRRASMRLGGFTCFCEKCKPTTASVGAGGRPARASGRAGQRQRAACAL